MRKPFLIRDVERGNVTLLYPLAVPYTSLSVKDVEPHWTDIGVDINSSFAGVLRIDRAEKHSVILNAFANATREIGYIIDGKVHWSIDPEAFRFDVVIDENGEVHNVQGLNGG